MKQLRSKKLPRSGCQNHRMPGRALRRMKGVVFRRNMDAVPSESSNARKGIKTKRLKVWKIPPSQSQNHRMPGRALRHSQNPYLSVRWAQSWSESSNARKGIKTFFSFYPLHIKCRGSQNHRMPGRALRLRCIFLSYSSICNSSWSESSNARKGIKTQWRGAV